MASALEITDADESGADKQRPTMQFFSDSGMDRFVAVVLNLAAELWSHKEHLRSREGCDASSADKDADLKAFIDRIFGSLREN